MLYLYFSLSNIRLTVSIIELLYHVALVHSEAMKRRGSYSFYDSAADFPVEYLIPTHHCLDPESTDFNKYIIYLIDHFPNVI